MIPWAASGLIFWPKTATNRNHYFIKLDIGLDSIAGWFKRQVRFLAIFLVLE